MNIYTNELKAPPILLPFKFTHNLMNSFIQNTEVSIQLSIEKYNPKEIEIEISEEENIFQYSSFYQGLYEHEVFIDDIFKNYFPSLSRRSALITIVATYEYELNLFCQSYAIENNSPVKLNDLKGHGFERINLFAKKIIGLNNSKYYPVIKKITKLRNCCAHNDGKIKDNDNQPINAIIELIEDKSIDINLDGEQIHLGKDFLVFVLNNFKNYINEIEAASKKN